MRLDTKKIGGIQGGFYLQQGGLARPAPKVEPPVSAYRRIQAFYDSWTGAYKNVLNFLANGPDRKTHVYVYTYVFYWLDSTLKCNALKSDIITLLS